MHKTTQTQDDHEHQDVRKAAWLITDAAAKIIQEHDLSAQEVFSGMANVIGKAYAVDDNMSCETSMRHFSTYNKIMEMAFLSGRSEMHKTRGSC